MILHVDMAPSHSTNNWKIDVQEDLGYGQEAWDALTKDEKEEVINDFLADLPEQPYWMVDKFKEEY